MIKDKLFHFAEIIIECAVYAMLFLLPLSISAVELSFVVAFMFFIVKKMIKPDFNILKDKAFILLALFFMFNTLSLFNSGVYLEESLKTLVFKWAKYAAIFVIMFDAAAADPRRMKRMIIVFLSAGVLTGMDGIFQKITGADIFYRQPLFSGCATAAFGNPNDLAAYLAPVALVLAAIFLYSDLGRMKVSALGIVCAVPAVSLLFTFSRGGWLALIAGIFISAVLSNKYKRPLILAACLIVILAIIPDFRHRVIYGIDHFCEGKRYKAFLAAFAMIKENPLLGNGIGTFMDHFKRYADADGGIYYAHNCFLQIWAETGVFSLISFILFVAAILTGWIKKLASHFNVILLGFICAVSAYLLHSFFDTHLYSLRIAVLFWAMLGMGSACGKNNIKR